jgi:hypothetical protein
MINGETAARYHFRLTLHLPNPPNNLRTPCSSLRTMARTMIAETLGDHVASNPKSRDCDAEYTVIKDICRTRDSAKNTKSAFELDCEEITLGGSIAGTGFILI